MVAATISSAMKGTAAAVESSTASVHASAASSVTTAVLSKCGD